MNNFNYAMIKDNLIWGRLGCNQASSMLYPKFHVTNNCAHTLIFLDMKSNSGFRKIWNQETKHDFIEIW